MLDIKFIRTHPDIVKEAVRKRGASVDIDLLLKIDSQRLELLQRVEEMRAKQNAISAEIAHISEDHLRQEKIEASKQHKALLQSQETQLRELERTWHDMLLLVPNIPDMSVPEGKDEEDNVVLKTWGEKPAFTFPPKDHITLMQRLGMVDLERGTKAHGFRGYYLQNDGALLSWAIWNYALDFFLAKGFTFFLPPAIVRKEHLYGTGHLPADADDAFHTQDEDYLAGTAEIPMMAYHANEVLSQDEFPKRYLAFSPCYRREAGSHGKDTKGLIRVHEFYKLEQVILTEASHQSSEDFFEETNRNHELFIESLGLPYRQMLICTGDLASGKVKSYDTELWVPLENTYREISSASYFHDYQTRRFNIRYKDDSGRMHFAHSLNCTAVPTPRILVSLVENFQKEDGSIAIPSALVPYFGKTEITLENCRKPAKRNATPEPAQAPKPTEAEAPSPAPQAPPKKIIDEARYLERTARHEKRSNPNIIPLATKKDTIADETPHTPEIKKSSASSTFIQPPIAHPPKDKYHPSDIIQHKTPATSTPAQEPQTPKVLPVEPPEQPPFTV